MKFIYSVKLLYFECARTFIFDDVDIAMLKKSYLQIWIQSEFILNFKVPS